MRKRLLSTLLFALPFLTLAQVPCGQAIHHNHFRATHPEWEEDIQAMEQMILDQVGEVSASRAETIIIPVVYHIIHDNGPENISDAQVRDAMRILNEDYNSENPELDEVVASFQNIIGDAEIEFRLAAKDPNGDYTTGIERIESDETYVGDDGSKLNPWPRDSYLNIWVTDVISVVGASAAAYAIRPANADPFPSVDGIISNHRYVGTIGTGGSGGGKTLTHEVGHYLDLPHTWGETNFPGCDGTATNPNDPCYQVNNCGDDDGINDTPNTVGVDNGGCNTSQVSCGSLDNIQNFMDYANCEAMFTEGQINRMRGTLNSSVADRNQLWTNANHAATGVTELTEARYYVESHTICRGETITFYDESRYDPDSWEWEITGPEDFSSADQHPSFTFGTPGYYTVKLTVTQGSTTESVTDEHAIYVSDVYGAAVPFSEDFSTPKNGWVSVNNGYEDDKFQWEYVDDLGFDDDGCYMARNLANDHKNLDELIFSSIDFRPLTSVDITFKVAYARTATDNNDKLSLLVSNDCGNSWIQVWSATAGVLNGGKPTSTSVFEPSAASDWESFQVSNVPLSWLGQDALIKFVFEPGGGNHLYLDDVNIGGDYSIIPYLVYPLDGSGQLNNNVVLDWRAVPGAESYEFQLSKNDAFTAMVASGTLATIDDEDSDRADTRFRTSDLEVSTTYFWRVRSKVGGSNSSWSEVWSFTVADDGVGMQVAEGTHSMQVFPNPAQDLVNMVWSSPQPGLEVSLLDVRGRVVRRHQTVQKLNSLTLSVSDLSPGVYLLKVGSGNQEWNQRLIIQ